MIRCHLGNDTAARLARFHSGNFNKGSILAIVQHDDEFADRQFLHLLDLLINQRSDKPDDRMLDRMGLPGYIWMSTDVKLFDHLVFDYTRVEMGDDALVVIDFIEAV